MDSSKYAIFKYALIGAIIGTCAGGVIVAMADNLSNLKFFLFLEIGAPIVGTIGSIVGGSMGRVRGGTLGPYLGGIIGALSGALGGH